MRILAPLLAALWAWAWLAAAAQGAGTGYIFVSNESDDTVSGIDGDSFEVIKTIATGDRPRDMRWNADHSQLLVATSGSDHIEIIDIATLEVVGIIEAGEIG